jgi:hypothetical protein
MTAVTTKMFNNIFIFSFIELIYEKYFIKSNYILLIALKIKLKII